MPEGNHKVLPLSESKSAQLNRKRKRSYAGVAKIYGKNESSVLEIVKKENKVCASFAVAYPSYKSSVKLEKALTEKDHIYITAIILLEFFLIIVAYCCSPLTVPNP